MEPEEHRRKLVAVLAADVAAYSRLMGADEDATMNAWWSHRKEVIDPAIAKQRGRIVKHTGDGFLAEFPSVLDAVRCAVQTQAELARRNRDVPADKRMEFRMGVNLCDILSDDEDIYGDGVNIAARLESLSEPGGIVVSGSVHEQVRGKLDLAWDDLGERKVKNIAQPVRAFRLRTGRRANRGPSGRRRLKPARLSAVGALAAGAAAIVFAVTASWLVYDWLRPPPAVVAVSESPAVAPPALPDTPSIAVLPFENLSGDAEQEYFSDGITEDLITDLSQISGLFVIARNSVFTYKGRAVKVQEVARDLGVSHVLEGSVRRVGDRVRINAQLIDAATGRHLWAERFDRDLTDVFALQDEVTQKIVAALAIKLTSGEERRLNRATQVNPEAYDMLLRGLELLRRFTRETNLEAQEYFTKAAALDPTYARAYADLALSHTMDILFGWTETPEPHLAMAMEFAKTALALDKRLPQVHFALADVYRSMLEFDKSIAAARRSVELDPNYADGYAQLAQDLVYAGRADEGITAIGKAMRLNPRHPFFYVWILGHAHFIAKRYEAAIAQFKKVLDRNPGFPGARRTLAAAYAHLGRLDEAAWEIEEILSRDPEFTLAKTRRITPYKRTEDMEHYIAGLRKAGLPE